VIINSPDLNASAKNFYLTAHEWRGGRVSVDELGHKVLKCDTGVLLDYPSVTESRVYANALWWAGRGILIRAEAGQDQTINEGETVWFDGSNSSQSHPPSFWVDGKSNAIDVRKQGKPLKIGDGLFSVTVSGSWTDAGTGRVMKSAWVLHGLNGYPAFPWVQELIVGENYEWNTPSPSFMPYFFLLDDSSTGNSGVITIHLAKDDGSSIQVSLNASVNTVDITTNGIHRAATGDLLRIDISEAWDNGGGLVYPKPFVYVYSGSADNSVPWVETLFSDTSYEFPVNGREHLTYFFLDQHTGDNSGGVTVADNTLAFSWDMNNYEDVDGDGDFTNDKDRTGPAPNYTYGDNGNFIVTLNVTDNRGLWDTDTMNVTVLNVNPSISSVSYEIGEVNASILFRIAGEKWHNVEIYLLEDDVEIGYANITRYPGSPNDQMVSIADIAIDFSKKYSATAYYTPMEDPVNGQVWGATPAWFILRFDGEEKRIHHTFNVRHEDTWVWDIGDLNQYFPLPTVTFEVDAYDVGSDDLKLTWLWGDGTETEHIYYNNGVSPDPYPSPDVNPITVTDTATHSYASAGTYTVTLTVEDDDGGVVPVTIVLTI
jgi:PKD repeat protein